MAERALSPPAGAAHDLAQGITHHDLARHDMAQQDVDAVIKSVDMSDEKQKMAVQVAADALGKYSVEKDAAMVIKKEFDRMYGTTWHCVVGRHFGSFVTHETKNFIYFYLGPIAILLWKTS